MADLLLIATMVSAIIGAGFAIVKAAQRLWQLVQRLTRLADAFLGEPPGPGVPEGRDGVLERLGAIEMQSAKIEERLGLLTALEHRVGALETQWAQLAPVPVSSSAEQATAGFAA